MGRKALIRCPITFLHRFHYMAVMDYDEADLAVLIGGNQFHIYNIKGMPL